ncbi:MAG: molecular chaperone GrpE [Cognaticolwellia sp.]|jgi:molecular chaperone GrpE
MSNWNKLKNFIGVDKNETMNKEELTQDVQEEVKITTEGETEVNDTEATEQETVEELSEIEKLELEVNKLKAEKVELNDKYLRLFAEFQNYRRRTAKEKMDIIQTAGRDVIKSLLPVLDDFNRAKKAADDDDSVEAFSEGVELVYEKLQNTLKQQGLKAVESNGEVFNADIHEAITEIPAPTEELKGKVLDTVESGYALNDKLIRYPKVVVGK